MGRNILLDNASPQIIHCGNLSSHRNQQKASTLEGAKPTTTSHMEVKLLKTTPKPYKGTLTKSPKEGLAFEIQESATFLYTNTLQSNLGNDSYSVISNSRTKLLKDTSQEI